MTSAFRPGLELAERFHDEVVSGLLDRFLNGVPYSAARIGSGSDVLGFDTERSTDHDWGPRLTVFLHAEDRAAVGSALGEFLDRELPDEFDGHPVRFVPSDGQAARHWVDIVDPGYFADALGAAPAELTTAHWLTAPTQILRELTGGRVFHDGLDVLDRYRAALAWYPEDVWRLVLACQWRRLDQEEPFVGRAGEVGDELGSAVIAARQVRDLMRLVLLMAKSYPPYSKWLGTAFARLPHAPALTPHLSAALAATAWPAREHHLATAYELVASWHNDLGLTEPQSTGTRPFHDRPFRVLDARRFGEALLPGIADPAVRELYPVGAIDQYIDCTDVTSAWYAERRRYSAERGGFAED